MFIRNGTNYIKIEDSMRVIHLEIKFNLTTNGKSWSKIGDALYYFKDIEVDANQFSFMKDLATDHLDSSSFSIVS